MPRQTRGNGKASGVPVMSGEGARGYPFRTGRPPALATRGMVASSHYLASATGLHVLREGGSAVDACIAMDATEGLVRDMDVQDTGDGIQVPVGPQTLGRIINVVGQPVDEAGPIEAEKYYSIHRPAPLFTDQAVVGENTFTAGTFDLTAGQVGDKVELANMLPGDSTSFDVTVGNSGSLELRYALTGGFTAATPAGTNLGEALNLVITDADATELYSGTAASATEALIGSSAEGQQAGDRTLAGQATETLTFTVTYPEDADNAYAGADATLNLAFDAEQTANNA